MHVLMNVTRNAEYTFPHFVDEQTRNSRYNCVYLNSCVRFGYRFEIRFVVESELDG